METTYIEHHGILGQKWGIRRYQNPDGTLTAEGKKRYGHLDNPSEQIKKDQRKKIITAAAVTAVSVGVATAYVKKNPAIKDKVKSLIRSKKDTKISDLSAFDDETLKKTVARLNLEKQYKELTKIKPSLATNVKNGIKEGINEASKEAPKKAVKAITTGVTLMAAKRMLDESVGKDEAARIFQANDSKKISKFWKVSNNEKDDD